VTDTRQYPERPIVGVGAVIVDEGRVVLIKRKYEPLKGHWSLPGGMVEIGETLESALSREMLEETGLRVDVGPVIEVFDRIMHDEQKRVRYHFVLIDYLCWPAGGTLTPGSDVDAAIWVDPVALAQYDLTEKVTSVIQRGLTLAREAPRPVR
jgi:8-oxo-dGTP diphosphatase